MSMFDDVLGMGRTSVCEGAYEPEVEEITMESVGEIPSYMDPIEFMTQVACEQEMNMQRLDMAIMAEEYVYLRENGEEMVNEAASIQGVIDKFKKGIDWLWENITKFFKEVQKKVDGALKLDERFLSAYETKAKKVTTVDMQMLMSANAVYNVKGTCELGKKYLNEVSKQVAVIYNKIENLGEKDTYESLLKTARDHIFGDSSYYKNDNSTAKAVMKAFNDDRSKESDTHKMTTETINVQKAIDAFKGSKSVKADLKEAYSNNKKAISQMYKGAKKLESLAKHKFLSTDQSKKIHIGVKVINTLGKELTVINKGMVKSINMKRSLLKKIIVKAASMGSDKIQDANKAAQESASLIDSVQFGEIL